MWHEKSRSEINGDWKCDLILFGLLIYVDREDIFLPLLPIEGKLSDRGRNFFFFPPLLPIEDGLPIL